MNEPTSQQTFTIEVTNSELSAIALAMMTAKPMIAMAGLGEASHSLVHKVCAALGIDDSHTGCKHAQATKEEWPELVAEEIPS